MGGWVEENEAVGMRCWSLWTGGWVRGRGRDVPLQEGEFFLCVEVSGEAVPSFSFLGRRGGQHGEVRGVLRC